MGLKRNVSTSVFILITFVACQSIERNFGFLDLIGLKLCYNFSTDNYNYTSKFENYDKPSQCKRWSIVTRTTSLNSKPYGFTLHDSSREGSPIPWCLVIVVVTVSERSSNRYTNKVKGNLQLLSQNNPKIWWTNGGNGLFTTTIQESSYLRATHVLSISDEIPSWMACTNPSQLSGPIDAFLSAMLLQLTTSNESTKKRFQHGVDQLKKNLGYLYAIQQGAELIYDEDDKDAVLMPHLLANETYLENARVVLLGGKNAFNYYPLMKAPDDFSGSSTSSTGAPPGFPVEDVPDHRTHGTVAYVANETSVHTIGVFQLCPNCDTMQQALDPLIAPLYSFTPYNAKSTVHTFSAFWALLLPMDLPERVSGVWRGYFAQTLFRVLRLHVAILPNQVLPDKNECIGLSWEESNTFVRAGKLLEFLSNWSCRHHDLPTCIVELWLDLYRKEYIGLENVKLVRSWIKALLEIGYSFPEIGRKRIENVVLMGQFNYDLKTKETLVWVQKWREHFRHVVVRGPVEEKNLNELRNHNINVFAGKSDRGFSSPIENLMNTLEQFKSTKGIDGVLYLHDDALLNLTEVFPNSSTFQDIIFTNNARSFTETLRKNYMHSRNTMTTSYYVEKGDSFRLINGTHVQGVQKLVSNLEEWVHNERCVTGFRSLFEDAESSQYYEPDGSLYVPPKGQSDFLYIPMKFNVEFVKAARLMSNNNVFLECALRKIVDILLEKSHAKLRSILLCTAWNSLRGTWNVSETCKKSKNLYGMLHPYKMNKQGIEAWIDTFTTWV